MTEKPGKDILTIDSTEVKGPPLPVLIKEDADELISFIDNFKKFFYSSQITFSMLIH